ERCRARMGKQPFLEWIRCGNVQQRNRQRGRGFERYRPDLRKVTADPVTRGRGPRTEVRESRPTGWLVRTPSGSALLQQEGNAHALDSRGRAASPDLSDRFGPHHAGGHSLDAPPV